MWTLTIAISSFRLHYSWKYRSISVLADLLLPKIYLSFKDGFYIQDAQLNVGIALIYILLTFLLVDNFRNNDLQSRLLNQFAFSFSDYKEMINVLDKLPNAVIISDRTGISYLNNTAKTLLKIQ